MAPYHNLITEKPVDKLKLKFFNKGIYFRQHLVLPLAPAQMLSNWAEDSEMRQEKAVAWQRHTDYHRVQF